MEHDFTVRQAVGTTYPTRRARREAAERAAAQSLSEAGRLEDSTSTLREDSQDRVAAVTEDVERPRTRRQLREARETAQRAHLAVQAAEAEARAAAEAEERAGKQAAAEAAEAREAEELKAAAVARDHAASAAAKTPDDSAVIVTLPKRTTRAQQIADKTPTVTLAPPPTSLTGRRERREKQRRELKRRRRQRAAGVAAASAVVVGAGAWNFIDNDGSAAAATMQNVDEQDSTLTASRESADVDLAEVENPDIGGGTETDNTEAFVVDEDEEADGEQPDVEVTDRETADDDAGDGDDGDAGDEVEDSDEVIDVEASAAAQVVHPMAEGSYRHSSAYGNRIHPIFGNYSFHPGTDFAAAHGTNIHVVADGVVTHAGPGIEGRSGTLVVIEHEINGQLVETWYTHMSPQNVFVAPGQEVNAGEVLGLVGSWGNSTGPHLHFEVHVNGQTVEPLGFLANNGSVGPHQAAEQ